MSIFGSKLPYPNEILSPLVKIRELAKADSRSFFAFANVFDDNSENIHSVINKYEGILKLIRFE